MTPAQAFQALLTARTQLPPTPQLNEINVVATAFSARITPAGLEPELILFHGHEGILTPEVAGSVSVGGVHIRYQALDTASPKGIPADQREFAEKVLTQPGALMGGARLLIDPPLGIKGTVGCIATRQGIPGFITCEHVVADSPDGRLYWPGPTDIIGERSQAITVKDIDVATAYGSGLQAQPLRIDAAFVPVARPSTPRLAHVHGLGPYQPPVPVAQPDLSLVGRPVYAAGAASGQRRGRIAGVLYEEYHTNFKALADYLIASADDAGFPMSTGGDSGSVWFLSDTKQPLALHFGRQRLTCGPRQHMVALASNLTLALAQLGATIP